ncbi:MAG: PQQ-dependent sugar dehydrogenase [Tepidisphaeraceae bacterium]
MHRAIRTVVVTIVVVSCAASSARAQSVVDPNLRVQTWTKGFDNPTGLAFLGDSGDALVLEKNTGRVQLMRNRAIVGTALDLPVANASEQGLLGVALSPQFATDNFVYLYYTASTQDGGQPFDNRVDRFKWNGSTLALDRHIVKTPSLPGPNHDGGKITFGRDNKLYVLTGDVNRNGRTANFQNATELTRSAAILRLNPNGRPPPSNPFFNPANAGTANAPLNDIYAYGVRNGFGLDFDPISGDLWDSENGPADWDEINRIRPGFNSGWEDVMGPTFRTGESTGGLTVLGPAMYYSDPRFSWAAPVAPTDVHFLLNSKLGAEYKSDLFVGTFRGGGALLHFELSPSRKTLALDGPLADTVADNTGSTFAEQSAVLFGSGFGQVSDIITGPGGMYVLSLNGNLYRVSEIPVGGAMMTAAQLAEVSVVVPEPTATLVLFSCASVTWSLKRPRRRNPRRRSVRAAP